MIRRHTKDQEGLSEIDMTPMIDVIFILLIFFIMTSSFVKRGGIEVHLPNARVAEKKAEKSIIITISEKGEIWLARKQVRLDAVMAHVERLHAENPEKGLLILADRKIPAGLLVQVIDQAGLAGVSHVSIAAEQGMR